MAKSEQSQKSVDVNYHKRLAMGEKLDGTSLKGKSSAPSKGGLSSTKKK
jgi:hypothetical protein